MRVRRYRDRERVDISQTGSRSRSTNSNNASVVTDAEEDSIASRIRNETKEEKETTIRQDAEYLQTNGKTTTMKKIIVTNIRHWVKESTITKRVNERRENLQLSHIYTENIIKKFYIK